ncbi:DUF5018 domain-containing protein [uncultured Sunxiuqinia sp.]|uniref:DUF5018 domain-containing protein n=1 Tax=Sunxiuqinia rutila TaxID=1397841 RepID=UPI00263736FC|nr:DUF5018 domain-containing protein [uncultured Sunxiuqinia sp.]
MKYLVWVVVIAACFIAACGQDEILEKDKPIAAIPLKMALEEKSLVSGDSLEVVFSSVYGTPAKLDIPISIAISDGDGVDISNYFNDFEKTITFQKGQTVLAKKFQLGDAQMTKGEVQLIAGSEITSIANSSVSFTISNSELCNLVSFQLSEAVEIVKDGSTIYVTMPAGADLTRLTPELEVSAKATYSPQGPQDFSSPVEFTVTAQDGVTNNKYTIIVNAVMPYLSNLVADLEMYNAAVKELEESGAARSAFNKWITEVANAAMTSEPYAVQQLTQENQATAKENAQNIYAIAVDWMFMDKKSEQAGLYLQKATALIKAWASINEPTEHTPRESLITPLYEAYSVIRQHIGEQDRVAIDGWIRKRADYYKQLSFTGNLLENNWNTIRINFLFYFSQILDDETLYNTSVDNLKSHIELNILENGVSHDFVNRDAFAYHSYNLLFYARILKAAGMYKDKAAATALYQLQNKKGSSIESCVKFWEPYMMDTENYVHLEFVNTEWAPDKDRNDYNKPYNPMGTVYVLDELRYIDTKCAEYVLKITSMNKYGRTFNYWMNSLQPAN